MPLLTLDHVSIAFGLDRLLDDAGFQIDAGERVCLIGRNGAGKSTLLKIIAGELAPDHGEIWRRPGLRIGALAQELPGDSTATAFEIVAGGLEPIGRRLVEYHQAALQVAADPGRERLQRLEALHHALDAADGWRLNQRVETVISRLQLPADTPLAELSGGWRRRVLLGRALVGEPELLLLDEPTNHLDIDTIEWLEQQLLEFTGGLLFVTHDRALLQKLATRIIELDRGRLTSWSGDYTRFLERKAAELEVEERHNAEFDKKLAQEEVWIRQGIKARRTRNEGRGRALEALRMERSQRREQTGRADFDLNQAAASGQLVIEAEHIGYAWQGQPLVQDFSIRILRGDRIGLIGPNGAGKTSLLNLLLGRLPPQTGQLRLGTRLEIAYFDQLRAQLDPAKSVIDNVTDGDNTVTVNGRHRHIISYLGDFLFSATRARTPVAALSGGERNRLLLARLFAQPANLLVMDEPTNDLDLETLELLEELLLDYRGTLLLVSHDRAFLDHVVTSCLVFEGGGCIREYAGGYSDWLRQRPAAAAVVSKPKVETRLPEPPRPAAARKPARLSFREQRELEQLPAHIEALEAEQGALQVLVTRSEFYRQEPAAVMATLERLKALEAELEAGYRRWEELEGLKT